MADGSILWANWSSRVSGTDDKDGKKQYMTEVVAEDVILLGGRGGEGGEDAGRPVSMPRSQKPPAGGGAPGGGMDDQGITDDDVPF